MNKEITSQVSGEDRISVLPNDIVCNILSNLYVEESARTSILSKRWHDMWLLSPITISDESIVKQSCMYCFIKEESSSWIVNVVSRVISTHPGPIHTCHFILPDWDEYHQALENTLKTLTLKGIRNLQIDLKYFEVPCFVLKCDSLLDVHLRGGLIPDQLPAHTGIFPNLRKLTLTYYHINDEFLISLLSSRSIVELALIGCHGFRDVVIESISLQNFYFKDTSEYDPFNLTIKEAPNLESFKCEDLPNHCNVKILNAPKLKALSRIDMRMSVLQLGNYRFDFYDNYISIKGEITYMPYLRSLEIAVDFHSRYDAKLVPHYLMCFPCLETLEVVIKRPRSDGRAYSPYDECYGNYESEDAAVIIVDDGYDDHVHTMSNINCFNHHLKNVRLSRFYGISLHFDFARLIVANAKVLETLTIVYGDDFEERWMKAQKHFLMQNRASETLQVEFLKSK